MVYTMHHYQSSFAELCPTLTPCSKLTRPVG